MPRREHAWIGGGLLVMIVATLFWMQGFVGVRTEPLEPEWTWKPGQTNDYRLAFESRLFLGDDVIVQSIKGRLSVRIESIAVDEVLLRGQLLDLELGDALTSEPDLRRALEAPFTVVLGLQGEFRRIRSPVGSIRARHLLEALFEPLTCELSPGSDHWLRSESHLGHRVQARYTRLPGAGVEKILMRQGMSAGSDARLRSLVHRARYRPSEGAAWLDFAHVESQAVLMLPDQSQARSRMELTMRALPPGFAEKAALDASPRSLGRVPATSRRVEESDATAPGTRAASDAERARLLALLDRLLSAKTFDPAILREVEALLRAHPELALLIPECVEPGISDPGSAHLLHLLELIGHPTCQVALCQIASSEKQDRRERLRALVALGGLGEPTPQSIARLQEMSDWVPGSRERAATALLALGALGPRLADPKDYEALKKRLSRRLLLSADDDEGLCLLDAMANTHDASLTEVIATGLSASSPRLRCEAAMALSKIPGRPSEDHLLRILSTSREKQFRVAAAKSLARRNKVDANTRSQVLLRLRTEPDAEVRHGLATLLSRQLLSHPELRPDLSRALSRETDDRVRAALLQGFLRSPGGLPKR